MTLISKKRALKAIELNGIENVLLSTGFVRTRRARTWIREQSEITHLIQLPYKRQLYRIVWGLLSPDVVDVMYGVESDVSDLGQAIVYGTAGTIQHPPAIGAFVLPEFVEPSEVDRLVTDVGTDARTVSTWLSSFDTRSDVRTFLLLN